MKKMMMALALVGAVFAAQATTRVEMKTSLGSIELELDEAKAPITVKNFVDYAKSGFYTGTIFHRVIDGFMVQGGGFTADMEQKSTQPPIKNEAGNGLKNEKYTIAMARTMVVDSATAQFFINVNDNSFLDHRSEDVRGFGYAVFGKVTKGKEVVDKIAKVETGNHGFHQNVPTKPVLIEKVTVLGEAASASSSLRVGTYNIRMSPGDRGTLNDWDLRRGFLAALVRKMNLDAFGMQEVMPDQADYLRAQFPDYTMVGVHREDGKRKGEASPVFYRKDRFEELKSGSFWLSETPDVPGSKSWGTACTRICSWVQLKDRKTGKVFCFANTHTDHISALARKEGMLLILRRMKEFAGDAPIVFTGDHNGIETSEPAQEVAKILKNAIHITETPPKGPWHSAPGFRAIKGIPAAEMLKKTVAERNNPKFLECQRIDYIYVSPGVKVKDLETYPDARPGVGLPPSDHYPVSATIEL